MLAQHISFDKFEFGPQQNRAYGAPDREDEMKVEEERKKSTEKKVYFQGMTQHLKKIISIYN